MRAQEQLDIFSVFADAAAAMPSKRTRAARVQSVEAKRPKTRRTIDERCAEFDAAHPEVYAEIERLAYAAKAKGYRRIGIAFLVEQARWNLRTSARDADGYKVNGDCRAVWARRIMVEHPGLAGMFELRVRRSKGAAS